MNTIALLIAVIILSILCIIIFGIACSFAYSTTFPCFPLVPIHTRNVLLEHLHKICDILETNQVEYTISGGTLLGSVRCQHIIEYDNDTDINILETDIERVTEILTKEENIDVVNVDFGIQVDGDNVYLDIFALVLQDNGELWNRETNTTYHNGCRAKNHIKLDEWKNKEKIFMLNNYLFYGIANPHRYLSKCYGTSYMVNAVVYPAHGTSVSSVLSQNVGRFGKFLVSKGKNR